MFDKHVIHVFTVSPIISTLSWGWRPQIILLQSDVNPWKHFIHMVVQLVKPSIISLHISILSKRTLWETCFVLKPWIKSKKNSYKQRSYGYFSGLLLSWLFLLRPLSQPEENGLEAMYIYPQSFQSKGIVWLKQFLWFYTNNLFSRYSLSSPYSYVVNNFFTEPEIEMEKLNYFPQHRISELVGTPYSYSGLSTKIHTSSAMSHYFVILVLLFVQGK